ncbi:MAG TPA: tetratricopeptide repeat protein [Thermoanaerobaculia bacterium]|nr:tetratricopeptide repeat protein [Thermoanaerobaculia bacterium]
MNHTPQPRRRRLAALAPPLLLAALPLVVVLGVEALWVHAAAAVDGPNLGAAIAAQRARVAEQPGSADALNDLGNLLGLAHDVDGAEAAYREALQLDPGSFSVRFNLGLLLRSARRPGEAVEVLEQAIELDPASAWAHYQLGAALQDLGRRKPATRAYARAFALDHRLALPDVNPLVIGNPLVTAAMLQPREGVPVADSTPRAYAEPARISAILLPTAPAPAADPATAPAQAPTTAAGAAAQPPVPPSSEAGSLVPPTSWSSADDEPGPDAADRQSVESGAATGEPRGTRRITPDDLRTLRILNQSLPPDAATPPASGGTRTEPGAAPERFRPGRRSSAQLDLRLIPGSRPGAAGAEPAALIQARR